MSAGDGSEFKSVGSTNGTCRRYLFVMLHATLFGLSFWDDYSAKSQWFIISYIIYIHIHMYIYIIIYNYIRIYIYTHTYTYIYTYTYIHIHTHTHIYICIHWARRAGSKISFQRREDASSPLSQRRSVATPRRWLLKTRQCSRCEHSLPARECGTLQCGEQALLFGSLLDQSSPGLLVDLERLGPHQFCLGRSGRCIRRGVWLSIKRQSMKKCNFGWIVLNVATLC